MCTSFVLFQNGTDLSENLKGSRMFLFILEVHHKTLEISTFLEYLDQKGYLHEVHLNLNLVNCIFFSIK